MGINLNVLTLKKNLIDAINGSGLPISVISYVVKDVPHEVQVEEQKIIQNEIQFGASQSLFFFFHTYANYTYYYMRRY